MLQACFNSVLPFTLIAWAERSVGAGLATILNSTSPIFIFLLSLGLQGTEKSSLLRLAGVDAGLAGICLIVGFEALGGLGRSLFAQLALVAAAVCYACAATLGRVFRGLDPMVPAAGSLLSGAAVLSRNGRARHPRSTRTRASHLRWTTRGSSRSCGRTWPAIFPAVRSIFDIAFASNVA